MNTRQVKVHSLTVFLLVIGLTATPQPASALDGSADESVVSTVSELLAVLESQDARRHIRLQPGDYPVERPLVVPDGMTLQGAGIMRMENELPVGFEPGTETTIRAVAEIEGDLLTLGNDVSLNGLQVVDIRPDPESTAKRPGNVVKVTSRASNDTVSARIIDCEIVNPNPFGVIMDGPAGNALVVVTGNPGRGDAPPPHEHSDITVHLERSIVRATGGGGALFIMNFAAHGQISVTLVNNLVQGPLNLCGGVSRPDLVTHSSTSLNSQNNLFQAVPPIPRVAAWFVCGASSAHLPGLASPGASSNALHLKSVDDRIEGFRTGLVAMAGRRWLSASGPLLDNRAEIELYGTHIETAGEGAADLLFRAAYSQPEADGNEEFPTGDGNVLKVLVRGATGSGAPRANVYTDVVGPKLEINRGTGNRLEFVGSLAGFLESNRGFNPAPAEQFFPETVPP